MSVFQPTLLFLLKNRYKIIVFCFRQNIEGDFFESGNILFHHCLQNFPIFAIDFQTHLRFKAMSKYEIPFLTACISAFGQRFAMTRQAAYRYLQEHKGLAFLIEFYDVEHLQSIDDTIDDLLIVCQQNGGTLV